MARFGAARRSGVTQLPLLDRALDPRRGAHDFSDMLYNILLAFMILVCILMVLVILAQRSEGGALGMGGGPSGFMTARGAGNFLTRTTWILAGLFFICAVVLIIEGNRERHAAAFENMRVTPLAPTALKPNTAPPAGAPATSGAPATEAAPPASSGAPDLGERESPSAKAAHPGAPAAPSSSPPASK
jgi:preprotein translocase subunit SecG